MSNPASPPTPKKPRKPRTARRAQHRHARPEQLVIAPERTPDLTFALSLYWPWGDWIVDGAKPIENRTWPPPERVKGTLVAVHTTKGRRTKQEQVEVADVRRRCHVLAPKIVVRGAIIGVLRVVGFVVRTGNDRVDLRPPNHPTRSPWFVGPYGWLVADVARLPRPIPCQGKRKLWALTENQRKEILDQLAEVARTRVPVTAPKSVRKPRKKKGADANLLA